MLNPAIERQTFFKKTVFQWLKAKKVAEILKPIGWKQKRVTEILKPMSWKKNCLTLVENKKLFKILNSAVESKKSCQQIFELAVENKKVIKHFSTWKQKCFPVHGWKQQVAKNFKPRG